MTTGKQVSLIGKQTAKHDRILAWVTGYSNISTRVTTEKMIAHMFLLYPRFRSAHYSFFVLDTLLVVVIEVMVDQSAISVNDALWELIIIQEVFDC